MPQVGYQTLPQAGPIDLDAVAVRRKQLQQQDTQNLMTAIQIGLNFMQKKQEMDVKKKEQKQQQDVIDSYLESGQFEVSGIGSSGKAKITRVKDKFKSEDLAVMKNILTGGTDRPMPVRIKSTDTMDTTNLPQIDLNTAEGMEKGAGLIFGEENWREDPQLVKAGIVDLYDHRLGLLKGKQEKIQAEGEPKIQPIGKGLASIGAGGKYKAAIAKYGEAKAQKIVDIAIGLQKQGMPMSKIKALMKEQGIDESILGSE